MQPNRKRLIIMVLILVLSTMLFVLGMIFLPDTLIAQVTASGADGNTLPKPLGLLLPFGLSVVFAILYYKKGESKNLLLALLGIAVYGLTFYFNRF